MVGSDIFIPILGHGYDEIASKSKQTITVVATESTTRPLRSDSSLRSVNTTAEVSDFLESQGGLSVNINGIAKAFINFKNKNTLKSTASSQYYIFVARAITKVQNLEPMLRFSDEAKGFLGIDVIEPEKPVRPQEPVRLSGLLGAISNLFSGWRYGGALSEFEALSERYNAALDRIKARLDAIEASEFISHIGTGYVSQVTHGREIIAIIKGTRRTYAESSERHVGVGAGAVDPHTHVGGEVTFDLTKAQSLLNSIKIEEVQIHAVGIEGSAAMNHSEADLRQLIERFNMPSVEGAPIAFSVTNYKRYMKILGVDNIKIQQVEHLIKRAKILKKRLNTFLSIAHSYQAAKIFYDEVESTLTSVDAGLEMPVWKRIAEDMFTAEKDRIFTEVDRSVEVLTGLINDLDERYYLGLDEFITRAEDAKRGLDALGPSLNEIIEKALVWQETITVQSKRTQSSGYMLKKMKLHSTVFRFSIPASYLGCRLQFSLMPVPATIPPHLSTVEALTTWPDELSFGRIQFNKHDKTVISHPGPTSGRKKISLPPDHCYRDEPILFSTGKYYFSAKFKTNPPVPGTSYTLRVYLCQSASAIRFVGDLPELDDELRRVAIVPFAQANNVVAAGAGTGASNAAPTVAGAGTAAVPAGP